MNGVNEVVFVHHHHRRRHRRRRNNTLLLVAREEEEELISSCINVISLTLQEIHVPKRLYLQDGAVELCFFDLR